MTQLRPFLQDWWNSILWVKNSPDKWEVMVRRIGALLLLLGLPSITIWLEALRPWAVYLAMPLVGYVFWKGGQSWQRNLGPIIVAELLKPDPNGDFHVKVRNGGGDVVNCRTFLDNVTDSQGNRTGEITSPAEIYWSQTLKPMRLFGNKAGLAPVVSAETSTSTHRLWVRTIVTQFSEGKPVRIAGGMTLGKMGTFEKQRESYLTIRIVFYTPEENGIELMDKVLSFSVKPCPEPSPHYEVTAI